MGIIYLAVSRLLNGAIGLVVVFLMSNYFSAEEYGLFGLLFATMTAISALCFSWMGAYFLRFANVGMHGPSIFHLTLLSLVGLFLCLTFAYLGRVSWGILEISLIGFGSVAVGCFYVTQEYLAGRQLYRSYFSVSFVRFCLALGFVGITMVFMPDLKIIIFVLSVAMLLPSLIVLFYQPYFSTAASNFRDFISLNPTQLTSISRYSFPFVAISLSAALMGLVDRYIIEHFLGLHSVGLYIGAHDLTTQIMAAATSVLVSRFLPPSAMAFETQGVSREFSRIFFRRAVFMLLAIFVLTAMCLIFAPITYLRLLAQEAQEAADAFYIMTILGTGILAVNTILFLIVLMLQKRTMAIFMVSIVSLITSVICNMLLVPLLGLPGAAMSFVLACGVGLTVAMRETIGFWKSVLLANNIFVFPLKR